MRKTGQLISVILLCFSNAYSADKTAVDGLGLNEAVSEARADVNQIVSEVENFEAEHSGQIKRALHAMLRGAVATIAVDILRPYGPNLDSCGLYPNYGICRDNATGQLTILAASLLHFNWPTSPEQKIIIKPSKPYQLMFAFCGSMAAKAARKLLLG